MQEDNTQKNNEAVRIMSRDEARAYNGITLDADGNPEQEERHSRGSFTFKTISLGSGSLLACLLLGVSLLAIAVLLFFAFLPVIICVLAGLLVCLVFRRQTMLNWWEKGKQLLSFWR